MSEKKSGFFPKLFITLGVLLLLTLAVWVFARGRASGQLENADAKLDQAIGSFDDYLAALPNQDANESALRLETLAAELGLDIVPKSRPGERPNANRHAVRKGLGDWLSAELASGTRSVGEPPSEVTAFLTEHRPTIDAIVEHVATQPLPEWERQTDDYAAPIPNLLGHLNLTRVLLVAALVDQRDGEVERAERELLTAWKLSLHLAETRPALISHLIALAGIRLELATLNRLDVDPVAWRERLNQVPYEADPGRAFTGEAHHLRLLLREQFNPFSPNADMPRWQLTLIQPVIQHGAAVAMDVHHHLIDEARTADNCDVVFGRWSSEAMVPAETSWNPVVGMVVPNLENAVRRMHRIQLDLALSRRVLDARERAASGSRPVVDLMPADCEEWSWREELHEDGSFTLTWEGPEPWEPATSTVLPMSLSTR
ncbi:MAG: hypothetical protein AAF533_29840 [Acidobacteriota bacterium]